MFEKKLILIVTSIVVLYLTGCTKLATDSPVQVNQQLASPYTMPANAYLALASHQLGQEKQSLLIMAAGRLVYDGQWRQGLAILSQTSNLSVTLNDEKALLLAKINLIQQQPQKALEKLASVQDSRALSLYYQVQFHELLALSYSLLNHTVESVNERIKLDYLLPDEASKSNNRRALWLLLTKLPLSELNTLAAEAADGSIVQGWMRLALIARSNSGHSQDILAELQHWKLSYPHHPAQFILPQSLDTQLLSSPQKMALLLPLTGPLAGPGQAIEDGFLAAYRSNRTPDAIGIRFYDTNKNQASLLYQQAINDGANYIVGPLTKADVAAVASLNHPVPTLLLNDVSTKTTANAYQFGLSPTNEARQVAAKARKNGLTRALIIAPSGTWGDEVVAAFTNQWQANGGQVIDSMHYNPNDNLNKSIRQLLQVTNSESRGKQIGQVLGHSVEATPQRRDDFDMIFLLAYPSKARQIMPLLRYYYAGDIPVFATSSVYSGSPNTMKDRDLNGIIFCDMPWVFKHQTSEHHWPEELNSYNRLYALGMDSYNLSNQLNQLVLFPAMGVSDHSGVLYLSGNQHISRILAFGQFKQGLATLIE